MQNRLVRWLRQASVAIAVLLCATGGVAGLHGQEIEVSVPVTDPNVGGGALKCCFWWAVVSEPQMACFKVGNNACSSTHPDFPDARCNGNVVTQTIFMLFDNCYPIEIGRCVEDGATTGVRVTTGRMECPDTPDEHGDCKCGFEEIRGSETFLPMTHCHGPWCDPVVIIFDLLEELDLGF